MTIKQATCLRPLGFELTKEYQLGISLHFCPNIKSFLFGMHSGSGKLLEGCTQLLQTAWLNDDLVWGVNFSPPRRKAPRESYASKRHLFPRSKHNAFVSHSSFLFFLKKYVLIQYGKDESMLFLLGPTWLYSMLHANLIECPHCFNIIIIWRNTAASAI